MCTLKIFVILLLALLVLGVLAFVFDSVKETESDNPNYPTRTYKIVRCCSFIVKFGMILTACALVGSLGAVAGVTAAMAFAIPKPTAVPKGSWFDHSHNVGTTMPFGAIVPIDWRFLNAGEKVKQNLSGFCRALQLKAPAMQDIDLKWATFFVPARLLCDKTEDIVSRPIIYDVNTSELTENNAVNPPIVDAIYLGPIGQHSAGSSFPYFLFDSTLRGKIIDSAATSGASLAKKFAIGSLMDYMGFPCESLSVIKSASKTSVFSAKIPINLLPLKAYHAICNHFFVDDCFRREDFFGSSSGTVNISTSQTGLQDITSSPLLNLRFSQYESDPILKCSSGDRSARLASASTAGYSNITRGDAENSPYVPAVNANTIRGMFALDEFARKVEYFFGDMRKQIKYMFGIITSDKSAMSPILVDAGTQPVQVSEVSNTTLQSVGSEQSRQSAGKMLSSFGKQTKTFEAEELGVYITLAWVRPRTCYLNKLPHQFETYLDCGTIPNPLFSEIGDVAVKVRTFDFSPFNTATALNDKSDSDFGYNTRYVLEKYTFDSFTGDFRDNLAYWHCAREFSQDTRETPSYLFRQINSAYSDSDAQSLNRIFSVITDVNGARPFQLQFRFNTRMWQLYPHIDDEL